MYPEYDPNEPTLGQSFANILRGFQSPQQWQEVGQGMVNTAKVIPNVAESLARGGVAQAVGTMGDLRDLRNTVQGYLPQSVQNFSNAAEFLTNPYAKALIQTAPTTESTKEFVPRVTDPYEGFQQHETLGEFIAPSLGYFGGKALKAGKNLPVGMSIEDVTPPAKIAEALRQPEKNTLGFYSPLDEAVLNLQNQKGTGQQYLAQLLKTQGVKQEEVATRGLDTFLGENPKVTKEQLINYLRENPVKLEETVLKADSPRTRDSIPETEYSLGRGEVIDDTDYINSLADDEYYYIKNDDPDLVEEFRLKAYEDLDIDPSDMDLSQQNKVDDYVDDMIRERANMRASDMYYEDPYRTYYDDLGYEVTGNDNVGYSITDPNGNPISTGRNGLYDISDVESRIREDAFDNGLLHMEDDEYGTKYHDYTLPNGENYREVLIQLPESQPKAKTLDEAFDMWMADAKAGKRGQYTPEELASLTKDDVHDILKEEYMTAKRSGNYQSGHFDEPNILAHFRTTDRTIDGKKTLFVEEIQSDWHQQGRKKGYNEPKALAEIQKQRQILLDKKDYYAKLAEPYAEQGKDAPPEVVEGWTLAANGLQELDKKQSALGRAVPDAPFKKNWQELAMKRAMQMAAEGGYDRVAFTTGKQQADRYNLSKQVDEIRYTKVGDDKYSIAAVKNGHEVIVKEDQTPDQLSDLIGKEVAKKIVDGEGDKIAQGNANYHSLSGIQLDVGGEGMKGFYDKILPDFINKYGKKHGLKVGKTKMRTSTDKQAAEDAYLLSELGHPDIKPTGFETVHYFDLTPEAKESFLKKGQPMFAAAPLGLTDEDTRREVLEKLFNSGN